ncbi:hypothetical protein FPANT_1148 [Fusarium pseudoanthophilum]|uniref:F-box domain-containing protein n=1 Tax=Fusarium pseudoanthophilum TaxID=48495 RepID=A0A8H5PYZ9_9HYPO|nr:hypothetical protein FPANT_1148 [Fusarium pseudoanthophilum]
MSTRRSARLHALQDQAPTSDQDDSSPDMPSKTSKRKGTVSELHEKPLVISNAKRHVASNDGSPATKKARAETSRKKTEVLSAKSPTSTTTDLLWSCPREILNLILDHIEDTKTLGRLCCTSKSYFAMVAPRLYERVNISVAYHAHIPKLIRTLEPFLSINQRKQLRKEGQYRGQQESFADVVDPQKKPRFGEYARQAYLFIGDPGRNHKYIVNRYVEEALKNMSNLEVVETSSITESISRSLASQKNLRALNVSAGNLGESEAKLLAKIKDLKYLAIHLLGFASPNFRKDNTPLSLILNSRTTLRSLVIETGSFSSVFLVDWPKGKSLTSLKSFSLTGATIDEDFLSALANAVDFVALEELKFGYLSHDLKILFEHLSDVFSKARDDHKSKIKLRNLDIEMGKETSFAVPEEQEAHVDARIDFISSFDTLTCLELHDYGQYRQEITVNPDLKSSLVRAILKHENLTKLKISYRGVTSGYKITSLEPDTVSILVDNLPELKVFEFIPEPTKLAEIARILCRGRNLTTITLITGGSWSSLAQNQEKGLELLHSIFDQVLKGDVNNDVGVFKWEDHSKITRVAMDWMTWEIGSTLGKAKKGIKKAKKMSVAVGKQKREVLYREIADFIRVRPSSKWAWEQMGRQG